jgi:peptidoglycan hydrolase-like protein with peptidoglycan-binding domain
MSYRGAAACLVVLAALAGLASGALAAGGGPSGGAGPGPTTTTTTQPTPPPPPAPSRNPFTGRGMWIWELDSSSQGNLTALVATARQFGVKTLLIKSGDGSTAWPQFNSTLVADLHANGIRACAWQYVYGTHPIFEAEVGAAAVQAGADCLLIDAESEYQGRYVQAQEYVKKLRQLIGQSFPVALAGFPYVDYHPSFPYSVFLGPNGAQFNVPQMYWADIGTGVDEVYSHTYSLNVVYGRPIEPLGEVAGNPPPRQVVRFRQLSRVYGASGVSWWDWQEASVRDWKALGRPISNLTGYAPQVALPTLSVRGAGGIWGGDLVVWAQEHLWSAGIHLRIDGDYRLETQAAVEQFQSEHGLTVTGVVDATTWLALLRYPAARVIWSTHKRRAVASPARAELTLSPPSSARLQPLAYEIPPHLGAGRQPRRSAPPAPPERSVSPVAALR